MPNPATIVVAAVLVLVVGLLVRYELKKRKSGGCSCGGDCGSCGCGCHDEAK